MSTPEQMSMSAPAPTKVVRNAERRSPIMDRVNPKDWQELTVPTACEDCSFFRPSDKECMMGFPTANHLRAAQEKFFLLSGRVAVCRFLEID